MTTPERGLGSPRAEELLQNCVVNTLGFELFQNGGDTPRSKELLQKKIKWIDRMFQNQSINIHIQLSGSEGLLPKAVCSS
jgi:hypothetical protein